MVLYQLKVLNYVNYVIKFHYQFLFIINYISKKVIIHKCKNVSIKTLMTDR